jgi:DNA-binding response OmpR family regulator
MLHAPFNRPSDGEGKRDRCWARRMRRLAQGSRECAMSTVLLVDNEPDAIEALRITFESQGHHTMTALDGWEAFELVSGKAPDVVITDWKMPRVDGLGLCRLLRHNQLSSGLPVILLSADEPPNDRRSQLYDAYLRKPIAIEHLLALVSAVLSRPH